MHHYFRLPAVNLAEAFRIWTPIIIKLGQLENVKISITFDQNVQDDLYYYAAVKTLFLLIQKTFLRASQCKPFYYIMEGKVSCLSILLLNEICILE